MTYQPSSWDLEPFQEKHGLLVETLRGVEVQAGDLLRFNRGLYSHWAVYIGMNHLCCAQHAQCGCSYIPSRKIIGFQIHFVTTIETLLVRNPLVREQSASTVYHLFLLE